MNKDSIERGLRAFAPAYLLGIFVLTVYGSWNAYVDNDSWIIGDWLINYQGGFVRRGFCGEIFFQLYSLTNISLGFYVFATQIFFYGLFLFFSFLLLKKQPALLPYIILIISPFIFAFQLKDIQGGYRKEIIYFAVLAFVAWSARTCKKNIFELVFLIVLLMYPLVVLSHEMLVIYLPYMVAIYVLTTGYNKKRLLIVLPLISFSILSFIASLVHAGTEKQVAAIYNSLGYYSPHDLGAIACLSKSIPQWENTVAKYISRGFFLEAYVCTILLSSIAYIPILHKLQSITGNRIALLLILISILGSLPLFLVAVDWGRFIYIHLVSLFILSLVTESPSCSGEYKNGSKRFCADIYLATRVSGNKLLLTLFIVFVVGYASFWHLPHSSGGKSFMQHSIGYVIYKKLAGKD